MIDEAERLAAVEAQKETWKPVVESLTFFKKSELDFGVFDLETWSIYDHFEERARETFEAGYVWLSKQWADRYLWYHIYYSYGEVYRELRKTMNQKEATKKAEAAQKELEKTMKERYP